MVETKNKHLSLILIAIVFLTLFVATAFVPLIGQTANAQTAYIAESYVYTLPYTNDKSANNGYANRYVAYVMYQKTAQNLLETSDIVAPDALKTWLVADYIPNKEKIDSQTQKLLCDGYNSEWGQYYFEIREDHDRMQDTADNALAVVFYTSYGNEAFQVIEQDDEETGYFYMDDTCNTTTGWINAPVGYYDVGKNTPDYKTFSTEITTYISSIKTWTGWCVLGGKVTFNGKVTLSEDVNLVLKDNAVITIDATTTAGLVSSNKTLTIYAQTKDPEKMGTLIINGGNDTDGSGLPAIEQTNIKIVGGNVICNGGDAFCNGPARAGADAISCWGESVTLFGGTLTADGGDGYMTETGGRAIYATSLDVTQNSRCYLYGGVNGDESLRQAIYLASFSINECDLPVFVKDSEQAEGVMFPKSMVDNMMDNTLLTEKPILCFNPTCFAPTQEDVTEGLHNICIDSGSRLLRIEKVGEKDYKIYVPHSNGTESLVDLDNAHINETDASTVSPVWNLDENGFYQIKQVTEKQRIFYSSIKLYP